MGLGGVMIGITLDMQGELPRVYWINSLTTRNLWDTWVKKLSDKCK